MNVLITGGAGYFGSVLVPLLIARGHGVRVVDNLLHSGESLLGLYAHENFSFLHGDICEASVRKEACAGMNAVVHLAAIVGDPACSRQPEWAKKINQEASFSLFEQAKKAGVRRFVFASTCSNYGRMADPNCALTEKSPLRPISLYAKSKVAVEQALLASSKASFPEVCVLRISTLYGLSPRMRFDLTVNEFSMELVTRRKLVIYGEQFWRPYIHVVDASRAVNMVLNAPSDTVSGQVFNVGDSDENYTKGRLVELIVVQVGHPVAIEKVHKDEDPRDYRVNFDKIQKRLGFNKTTRVPDGIIEIVTAVKQGVFADVRAKHHRN
jgi:nucleoside-diphosphate-sugar epimerase